MTEFTGERVIPGLVNEDLWAEHVARYEFAARFAAGKRVLDAGCGTGYGARELAGVAESVMGIDAAWDAVAYARGQGPGARGPAAYCQARVETMPFRDASFDLVVAFEIIEHLHDWPAFLREARRVLTPDGFFVVSTPNRAYYTESRGEQGPNPYHVHEFEYDEFREELSGLFPRAEVWLQNWVEGVHVQPAQDSAEGRTAHFFIGVGGPNRAAKPESFTYVPRAANMLRERERHIRKLEIDLAQQIRDHAALQRSHEELMQHLDEKNRWALELEGNRKAIQQRVVELQDELYRMIKGYERKVAELENENRAKTEWALQTEARLTTDLAARAEQLADMVRLLDKAEATVVERTEWAQRLDTELAELRRQLAAVRESRWVKLGRSVGVGPQL